MSGTGVVRRAVPESGTESAARVADVLLALAASTDPLGVTSVSARVGLAKAVVHRILRSLKSRDLVHFDEASRTYGLGPAALALGARALESYDLRAVALPVLRSLQNTTGETTTVSSLVGASRIYLDQVVSHRELKMMVETGRAFPLHAGSSSKVILAFASPELREQVLAGDLPALTPRTITDRAVLGRELRRIARNGVAVSRGERQHGAGSVAAPVFGRDGQVVGAISVCGPISRFDADAVRRYAPLVRRAADEISRALQEEHGRLGREAAGG
jgi:IclR family acetate operon transcriptional repressor